MKSKKGFTLIELLATIVILGIITLIAVPAVTIFLAKSKDVYKRQTIENIKEASKQYLIDYPDFFSEDGNNKKILSLKTLTENKYLYDSKLEKNYNINYSYIEINKNEKKGPNENISYDVCLVDKEKNVVYGNCELFNLANEESNEFYFVDFNGNKINELTVKKGSYITFNFKYEYYYQGSKKIDVISNKSSNLNLYVNNNSSIVSPVYQDGSSFYDRFKANKEGEARIIARYVSGSKTYYSYVDIEVKSSVPNYSQLKAYSSDVISLPNYEVKEITGSQKVYVRYMPYDNDSSISCQLEVDGSRDINDTKKYGSVSHGDYSSNSLSQNCYFKRTVEATSHKNAMGTVFDDVKAYLVINNSLKIPIHTFK